MRAPIPVPRILIVEDHEQTRSALETLLQTAGYEVVLASDGEEGVHLARSTRPDAIVLDLVLPRVNGFDTAMLLKRDEVTSSIPLIAATASWLGSDTERLREIGFRAAIRKPFTSAELLDQVREALTAGQEVEPSAARSSDYPSLRHPPAAVTTPDERHPHATA